jgi:transposase
MENTNSVNQSPRLRIAYPTDLSDKAWEVISPIAEVEVKNSGHGGRPRYADIRQIVNAILYVLATGVPWRMLPHDFPKWQTVRTYYDLWQEQGLVVDMIEALKASKIRVNINKKVKYKTVSTRLDNTQYSDDDIN